MTSAPDANGTRPLRRLLPRFSLRTLLVMLTTACLLGGLWANTVARKRNAILQLQSLAAKDPGDAFVSVSYRYLNQNASTPFVPRWLRPVKYVVGQEAFGEVSVLVISNATLTDDDLQPLAQLPNLRSIWLYGTHVTDDGLRHLQACPNLINVNLEKTAITDKGLRHMSSCRKLTELRLDKTAINGDGLRHLHGCPQLTKLSLNATAIDDEGVLHLAGLTELETLSLCRTRISDAGVEHLAKLKNLKWLQLDETEVTENGRAILQQSLPKCIIGL